ncbi:hypothetical protein [Kitasatospora sp. McL0602]|uniref:hypothetical protein n=1 Tax=Kitasatospora sp. McL0602 TaxID=3439530 RepID=UPI003F885F9D
MTDTDRAEFTTGLRQFADWLDANTQYPIPSGQRILLALSTNPAVQEFADRFDLETVADPEGNLSAEITFGPVSYHAYGYTDFDAHWAAARERAARTWAANRGLEFVAKADA